MFGLGLALSAAAAWGIADFTGGLISRGRPAALVVLGAQSAAMLALLVVMVAASLALPQVLLVSAVVAGVSSGFAAVLLYRALAIGPMGVVAPIFALSAGIPVVTGFVEGEHASVLQLLGILAAIGGCALAARGERGGEPVRPEGILTAIAATACVGVGLVGLHAAAQTNAMWGLEESRVAELLTVAGIVLATQRPVLRDVLRPGRAVAIVGLIDVGATVCYANASSHHALVVISVLASIYPVVTILLARAILHELLPRTQRLGALTVFAGVALLVAG